MIKKTGVWSLLCLLMFAALPMAHAQPLVASEAVPYQPLGAPVDLRLAGEHRFRIAIVVRNAGSLPDGIGKVSTLDGAGAVQPVPGGFSWSLRIHRSQFDQHVLTAEQPLVNVNWVTDEKGALLRREVLYSSAIQETPEGWRHFPYLYASAGSLGGISALLPSAPLRQGDDLGSMQATLDEVLNFLSPSFKLDIRMPMLTVSGVGRWGERQVLRADARAPVSFNTPFGSATVQSESFIVFALDTGLPLAGQFKLSGALPGGAGKVDFSVDTRLRPD